MANPLDGVTSWLYHLGNVDATEAAKIGADNARLVVIDYAVDASNGTRPHTPAELNVMRGGQDKLIVSYLSIGEAEDYRPYWQSSWDSNPPDFLSGANPEWPDNYKVKYWDPAWQTIMFQYVDQIIASGFNGVYMDIIDAYQYWEDIDPVPGMDYAQEMADFVAAIRAHAEAKLASLGDTRDFVIMGQNAEDLIENATYRDAIDGMGKEDLRFYYENGHEDDFAPAPNGWYEGSKPYLELAEESGVQVFVVEYMTQARQTQYASMLQTEIKYLRDNGIPIYVSEDRDLTGIYPQPPGTDLPLSGNSLANTLIGTVLADMIYGLGGNDTLNGGRGADTMFGGAGNDLMYVDNAGDRVVENAGEGNDRVLASVSYKLTANSAVELLTTTLSGGKSAINLTGNTLKQEIIGNAGRNVIGDGGGSGADTLRGLSGNDVYVIGNAGSKVVETSAQGAADRVAASVSYVLAAGVYVEQLTTNLSTGTTAINLTGNVLKQEITGNYGDNVLRDGGGAADHLRGLAGNDTYQIYSSGTTIAEGSSQGTADKVMAAVDYALKPGVYVEIMTTNGASGTAAIDLTGNALKQYITGNAGANVLSEGAIGAADKLSGLGGNDTYRIYNSGAVIVETASQGTLDKVLTSTDYRLGAGVHVEQLQTNSSSATTTISLVGNEIAQKIIGNAGINIIDGKGGSDTLYGGAGRDYFTFSTAPSASNVDTIVDFKAPDDTIRLENAIFKALTATGPLASSAFWASTAGVAHDSNDRIIYDTVTGRLFYDANGSAAGGSIHFATLTGHPTITAADFVVI
jgi:uncharacterized protein (TIGR01370 family)